MRCVGLTFSGHATRTTVGNTWRCYIRLLIVLAFADIELFLAIIGGDDNSIYFFDQETLDRFKEALNFLNGTHARILGLDLKVVTGLNSERNNF